MSESHTSESKEVDVSDVISAFDAESISNDLRKLAHRPVNEHPAVFEAIHRELHAALQDLDTA